MYMLEKRVQRYLREISPYVYPKKCGVGPVKIHRGKMPQAADPYKLDGWEDFQLSDPWTMPDSKEFVLFRFPVTVPKEMDDCRVMLHCVTNKTDSFWMNPQFLVYVDGVVRQACDVNHQEVLLCGKGGAGRSFDVIIIGFGGFNDVRNAPDPVAVQLFLDVRGIDDEVAGLRYDIQIPLQLLQALCKDSAEYKRLLEILNETLNRIDLLEPGSDSFYNSVSDARNYIRENLYDDPFCTVPALVSCVGQTHIDVAWLWRYCHTREKAARSFATVLGLMDEYPDYKFTMSQPQLFQFVKEDYPDLFRRIQDYVRAGRFEIEGGMWVEADTNVPSGESLVRQFLYGTRFNMQEFGVTNKMLWMPDVFGYSANLPQILKKCGLDYFMTTKLASNEVNQIPNHTFLWRGIDGSEVLTQLLTYAGSYNGSARPQEFPSAWNRYKNKEINSDILYTFGHGDGGGGPTREMIETISRFKKGLPGAPKTRFTTAGEYFTQLEERVKDAKRLPVWTGELYYEKHRGTYSTLGKNKRFNRKAEVMMANIEWAATLSAELFEAEYPKDRIDGMWRTVLINQFHDVLPGSSIREVYLDTDEMYADLFIKGEKLLSDLLEGIAAHIRTEENDLVVFNPLSYTRASCVYFDAEGDVSLSDSEYEYPAQKTRDGRYVAVVDDIPSRGWKILKIIPRESDFPPLTASDFYAENDYVSLEIDRCGNFISLYDKLSERETFREGQSGRLLIYEDKPYDEDNWNLDVFYTEKCWDFPASSVGLVENGPVRSVIRIRREFHGSWLEQYVTVWPHTPRIDIENVADWHLKDIVIKAEFPVDVNADCASFEIQFGHLRRPTHTNTSWEEAKFEVCGHRWADMSDNGFGLSVMNDCKYGYDMKNGSLRMTLFRTTRFPNPDSDVGSHIFTYSMMPHEGSFGSCDTVAQAYDLNYPVLPVKAPAGGNLRGNFSMLSLSCDNVVLETVKRAEDGGAVILRLYEAYNTSGPCVLNFYTDLASVEECDLLERPISTVEFGGNSFTVHCRPFEIKTFRVTFAHQN